MIDLGIFDVIVSFIVGFGVAFGFLTKAQLFGKDKYEINMFISFAIGVLIALSWSARAIIIPLLNITTIVVLFLFVGFVVIQWLNLDASVLKNVVSSPISIVILILIISLVYIISQSSMFNLMTERIMNNTNINVPDTNDLSNPVSVLMQPQIWGSLLILGVLAFISYLMSPKKIV